MIRRKGGLPKAAIWVAALIIIAAALTIYFISARQSANNGTGSLPERDAKEKLSLRDLRELAGKGDSLRFEDFRGYTGADVSSSLDYHIMVYGVEGGYRLIVRTDGEKIDAADLERIYDSGGSGIDIRDGDVDAFIRDNPSAEDIASWRGIQTGSTQEDVRNVMGEPDFMLSGLLGEGYRLIDGAGVIFYYDNDRTVSQIRKTIGKGIISVEASRYGNDKKRTFTDFEAINRLEVAFNQRTRAGAQMDIPADYSVKIFFHGGSSEEYELRLSEDQCVLVRDSAAWLLHPDANSVLLEMLR